MPTNSVYHREREDHVRSRLGYNKGMSDKVKQIAPVIWDEIRKANNILLHLHRGPDPDSVGSALAMMHLLQNLKKNPIVIAGDTELSQSFSVLPGFDQIVRKNYREIDSTKFDLFIISDESR